jgi:hypothetical protein
MAMFWGAAHNRCGGNRNNKNRQIVRIVRAIGVGF